MGRRNFADAQITSDGRLTLRVRSESTSPMPVYVTVQCRRFSQMSVTSFAPADTSRALKEGVDISLTCGFGGTTWAASLAERSEIARLLSELERVGDRAYLRRRH